MNRWEDNSIGDAMSDQPPMPDREHGEFVLVPKRATDVMMCAGVPAARAARCAIDGKVGHVQIRAAWEAMLAAAPAPATEADWMKEAAGTAAFQTFHYLQEVFGKTFPAGAHVTMAENFESIIAKHAPSASASDDVVRLREALKPFAAYAERLDSNYTTQGYSDACPIGLDPDSDARNRPRLGDCRRARAALSAPSTSGLKP